MSPRFMALLEEEGLAGRRILDVGCGQGRIALWLARRAAHVVGLDRDRGALEEARRRAAAVGLTNVAFHETDVEQVEYRTWAPDIVLAHLCASDAIIERAGRALSRGGCLALVAFHDDQWRETGRPSRFAYDEDGIRRSLGAGGLFPEVLEVDQAVQRFAAAEEALAAVAGLERRWRADGRWDAFVRFVAGGGRTLTRSHLLVKARKP